MLQAILNKSWRQYITKQKLYGHLPPIMKTIQVRQTWHAGHCWRSKDELTSNILQLTSSHRWTKVRPPARTYIQQLCADAGCSLETSWEWWTIETGGERGSGRSMLAVRHDDDNDLFNSISTPYELFNIKIGFICKCSNTIISVWHSTFCQ